MLRPIAVPALLVGSLLGGRLPPVALGLAAPECPPCSDQLPPDAQVMDSAVGGPDASGAVETLVVYFVPRSPSGIGRIGAIVVRAVGGEVQSYQLGEELGETRYGEATVRDLNGDGRTELAAVGGFSVHSYVMHIFRWGGSGYEQIGDFFGDSGIGLHDVDGDGIDEVIVGRWLNDRAQLEVVETKRWNGAGWERWFRRWGFTFNDPESRDHPEAAVLGYYLAIADRDYRTAWELLAPAARGGRTFDDFVQSFATIRDLRVEDLEVIDDGPTNATVRVEIATIEADGGSSRTGGTWAAERTGGAWRLAAAQITPR